MDKIFAKGSGSFPHAASATRPAAKAQILLGGVYGQMKTLTDDQRARIADIQKETAYAQLAAIRKIAADQQAKIDALLSDEQKEEMKKLMEQPGR